MGQTISLALVLAAFYMMWSAAAAGERRRHPFRHETPLRRRRRWQEPICMISEPEPAGIIFYRVSNSEPGAICLICESPVVEPDVHICRRCRTPHHPECWKYIGGCGVYGCAERN